MMISIKTATEWIVYQDSDSDGYATETVMISQDVICGNDMVLPAFSRRQTVMITTRVFSQWLPTFQMMGSIRTAMVPMLKWG